MTALIIIGAFILWIFIGLAVFIRIINRTDALLCGGDNAKVCFGQIFAAENLGDPFFWTMVALGVIWPAVLLVWHSWARKVREPSRCPSGARRIDMSEARHVGVLFYYEAPETTWVTHWNLLEDGKTGWDAHIVIEAGDHLKVFSEDGRVLFDGVIDPDYRTGWTELLPGYGTPRALGCSVCWTQRGWEPDDWARLFIRREGEELRAELIKKK